jgi:hypothetical protein
LELAQAGANTRFSLWRRYPLHHRIGGSFGALALMVHSRQHAMGTRGRQHRGRLDDCRNCQPKRVRDCVSRHGPAAIDSQCRRPWLGWPHEASERDDWSRIATAGDGPRVVHLAAPRAIGKSVPLPGSHAFVAHTHSRVRADPAKLPGHTSRGQPGQRRCRPLHASPVAASGGPTPHYHRHRYDAPHTRSDSGRGACGAASAAAGHSGQAAWRRGAAQVARPG